MNDKPKAKPTTGERQSDRAEVVLRSHTETGRVPRSETDIRNLSATGLMFEADADLAVGYQVTIAIPEVGDRDATIIWNRGNQYGCELVEALPRSALSAARLRSDFLNSGQETNEDPARSDDKTGETLGRRLKRLRKARRMSVVEFARLVDVSRPTVWYWEADKSLPRPANLAVIAEILDVPENELLGISPGAGEDGERPLAVAQSTSLASSVRMAKDLVAKAAGISPDDVIIHLEL